MTQNSQFLVPLVSANPATAAGTVGTFVAPFSGQIAQLTTLVSGTATTGTTVDVLKNGTSIFTGSVNTAPAAAAGTNVAVVTVPVTAISTSLAAAPANGLPITSVVTNNVTSGVNVIAPYTYQGQPLTKFAVGDVIKVTTPSAGTSNAGVTVTLHCIKV